MGEIVDSTEESEDESGSTRERGSSSTEESEEYEALSEKVKEVHCGKKLVWDTASSWVKPWIITKIRLSVCVIPTGPCDIFRYIYKIMQAQFQRHAELLTKRGYVNNGKSTNWCTVIAVGTLTTDDECTRHATSAACYQ